MTLNGVMALFCVISANSGSFRAHCIKVHVRYLISWWVLVYQLTAECCWVHWRHLANTIEILHIGATWLIRLNLCFLFAHPSPQPKQQIDRFSHFCTAHSRRSLYFTTYLIRGSLNPHESSTQTACRSLQPFLQGSLVWQTDRQTTLLGR